MAIYSHSKISAFEQCPQRYKFRYIDKLKPEIKQTIEGFLGSTVHSVLEWVYEVSPNKEISMDEVIEKYAQLWHENFSEEVKVIKPDKTSEFYFNKGVKFLINYYTTHNPFRDNTIAIEKKVNIDLNEDGKYIIIGYIDRLVHDKETNVFEIHDYKTSSSMKSQEQLDNDRQLALYSMGIKRDFDLVKEVKLIWHFLDFNQKMISYRTEEQLEELKRSIIEQIDKIESATDFPACPSILCAWCEFKGYCPQMKDQEIFKSDNRDCQRTLF